MTMTLDSDSGTISTSATGLQIIGNFIAATGISPPEVSPIAFRTIEIQLASSYPALTMTKEDFTVWIVPDELEITHLIVNNDGKKQLNVVAIDATAKTITVKYGGAFSGTYNLLIKSEANGNLNTAAV